MTNKSCCKCSKMAVWLYMPMTKNKDIHFCDNCVPRGCSCNIDPDTQEEDLDSQGRKYPCCEFFLYEEGIEE